MNSLKESYWALEREELGLGKLINSHTNIVFVFLPVQSSSTCCSFCRLFAVLSRRTESLGEEIQIARRGSGLFSSSGGGRITVIGYVVGGGVTGEEIT